MKSVITVISISLIAGGLWLTIKDQQPPSLSLTGKSSDPKSPQQVGNPAQPIDPQGPAPSLYLASHQGVTKKDIGHVDSKNIIKHTQHSNTSLAPKTVTDTGEINSEAVEYYRKRGLLGASKEALAVLRSQADIWQERGEGGLSFEQVGGGLNLNFETDQKGLINGATVDIDGGGAGARLMSIEMWMTGMENPWDLYWETQQPGSLAGTIPTPDGQELHYFCDMVAMDEAGALNQPSHCHFLLNQPTPEYLNYKQQGDAPPLQKAMSRLEP